MIATGGIISPNGVVKKRAIPDSRITRAACEAIERVIPLGCVVAGQPSIGCINGARNRQAGECEKDCGHQNNASQ
jgi:hypothetical protein